MKTVSLIICLVISIVANAQKKWDFLLDQELSNWDTYLSYSLKNGYDGSQPLDNEGNAISPVGLNSPGQKVFTVITQEGEKVLRVSGEIYGCIITKETYENYHLKLQVKWGDKKYEPRKEKLKDSGIMYHSIGELGTDYFRTWMLSQEFQIMEGHMGDYWSQQTSAIDIKATPSEGMINSIADHTKPFMSLGEGQKDIYCMRSINNETPNNGWNTLELICYKGKSLHIVNGKVVMVLQNSRNITSNGIEPLVKGKIQIQSEAAEVFFKNIKTKDLDKMPSKYESYFK